MELNKYILEKGFIYINPDVVIALWVLLDTQPQYNCSTERSFSALNIVKNKLRSTQNKTILIVKLVQSMNYIEIM